MSNPADPNDPNGPNSPDHAAQNEDANTGTGSRFEFTLPEDADTFNKLPPIPSPDFASGPGLAPPPPPNPFGFGTPESRGSFGDFGLPPVPEAALEPVPAEDAFELPELSAGAGDSAALLTPPDAQPLEPPLHLDSADLPGVADLDQPIADSFELPEPPVEPAPDHMALAEIDLSDATLEALPIADGAHAEPIPVAELEELPDGSSVNLGAGAPQAGSLGSVPDVNALRPARPASNGSTAELPRASLNPADVRGSSFEFELPSSVNTYSDLPPVPGPDELGSKSDFGTLPPRPAAVPRDASFDFINVGSRGSFADLDANGRPVAKATPAPDPAVRLGNVEPVEPVAPVSGWLDPESHLSAAPHPDAVGASDIFAAPAPHAEPSETSDVLAATSGSQPFEVVPPPLGSASHEDDDFSDLPLAEVDDAPESGDLHALRGDDESIHDMPAPDAGGPLFDSGPLVNAPDLPPGADDEPDYGAPPAFTPDASSILADLSAPDFTLDDASSVQVEAPGIARTLGSGPSEAAFELTVPDDPISADLFGDAEQGGGATGWDEQSGPNLLAGRSGGDEPTDLDLLDDDAPLSSAPSSIFSGARDAGNKSGKRTAPPVPPDATVAAEPLGTGSKNRPAVPNIDSRDFELPGAKSGPADDEAGQIDFEMGDADDGEHTRAAPQDVSLSAIIRDELPDDSEEMSTRIAPRRVPNPDDETRPPEVSLDYLSESTEGSALALPLQAGAAAKSKAKDKSKKGRPAVPDEPDTVTKPTKVAPSRLANADETGTEESVVAGRKGSGLLVGALFGALAAGGAWAGVYFGDVIPNARPGSGAAPVAQTGTKPAGPAPAAPAGAVSLDPQAAFAAGAAAKAVEHYKATPPATLTEKTDAGYVRVFAKAQALAAGATVPANDADLLAARKDLEDVIARPDATAEPGGVARGVKASVALGASYELAGDLKAARKVYTEAAERYPAHKATFEAHLDRLDATAPPAPSGTSRRPASPETGLLLATALLLQDAPAAGAVEPGVYYWKAVKAAGAGKYKDALELIDKAKESHQQLAPGFSGRGVNALSDPREQIFARACDDLKAYWKLRGAVSGNPDMIAEIKKDGGALAKSLDAFAKSSEVATAAEKEVAAAREAVKKLEGEVVKLGTDAKASEQAKREAETKLEKAAADLKTTEAKLTTATDELKAAAKDIETKQGALAALADVLKPATPVPDKWGPADLLAATKAVVARATGPDLKALVPSTMAAVGGGGLTTGQLVEIAERLNKAETVAKDALAKLTTETKRLTDAHAAETKKLKEERATEAKKLTDAYAADIKKLNDAHAEAVKALKDGSAEELKKLTDKYAADSKKLTDDYAAAVAKLKDEHATALRTEQDKTEAEKKKAAAREIEFQKQLGSAVTPGQVMDLWIPILADLRRASDAGPALAAAQKTIASSSPDSEDAAKGQTVAGLAYLIRGELASAREMFQAARRSPAHKAAAGKPWAVAADTGLDAVTDPAAAFRRPVVLPPVDLRAAAGSLNTGIAAYKGGRYDAAVSALLDAVKHNPADPVAWYFLGAARWARGDEEQAKKDFAQGAEREKVSTAPNSTTSDALSPLQGAARDAIDRVRP
ncbi:Tetratricopeptide repeat protein [Gemmata obscuriglobus]|uniref:Tetratricopeptide repeat protein n=1 Tax=Gemmata obscuriglobus TaxID=114 RepID=A0A2Z3HJT2_9BACT|nr:hypothetical protein [Gemmata obscuriglobus]AWM41710.1 hypothetical protein C1280_35095 [Gemmata obscuriglobus]QEG32341.1 Tetratricopeptide repeat protein [Gemmata obscuriglobus]VTS11697.1 hypothetical protein : : TPR_2: TPR_11 [Gemmata obscuriglobus UQM 2246]